MKKLILDPGDKGLFEGTMDRFYGVENSLTHRYKIKRTGNPGKNSGGVILMKV